MRGAKLLGAAIGILLLATGNFGQVGLSQEQIPPVRTLGFGHVESVVFSPDGRYLAVGPWGGGSVQLIDTSSWQVIRTFEGHTDGATSVAFSPDGRLLASGSADATIKLWDISVLLGRRGKKGRGPRPPRLPKLWPLKLQALRRGFVLQL